MIKITIELDSRGLGQQVKELGTLIIANDGVGGKTIGHYNVRQLDINGRTVKTGHVKNHKRTNESIWKLINKSLTALGHGETE